MMKSFNLERALAGEPVILRNGTKAYIRHYETHLEVSYPLIGFIENGGYSESWVADGRYDEDLDNIMYDIIGMWPKEPLTMPDSFWDTLHPHYNSIAKEASGTWYAYSVKPEKDRTIWVSDEGDFINLSTHLSCSIFPDCDWEDFVIIRPSWTI